MPAPDPLSPRCERRRDDLPCGGVAVPGHDVCLAHLDPADRSMYLRTLGKADATLDLRDTEVDGPLLDEILKRCGGQLPRSLHLENTRFVGPVSFRGATFTGEAIFRSATFSGAVTFDDCVFTETAAFDTCEFAAMATFRDARFGKDAYFDRTEFGSATFSRARFAGAARFSGVRFREPCWFDEAQFDATAAFDAVQFDGSVVFRAKFTGPARLGVRAHELRMSGSHFERSADLRVEAVTFFCNSTRFDGSVTLRVRYAAVTAENVVFGAPSSISRFDGLVLTDSDRTLIPSWIMDIVVKRTELRASETDVMLLSLQGTDVSNLMLSDVYLGACRFAGTHRLEALRIEGFCQFAQPPKWRARRQILAEEARWRDWESELETREGVQPERISAMYRSLRKSFEDSKNEAGAGDFYYGEMEMRRRAPSTRRAERLILWFYWLLSGYGQRAGRALLALLVLISTVAGLLVVWGQPVEVAARIAVGAVVFRDDRTDLTATGEWTVLVARFLGPVLLALAVLAVRARVKR